MRRLHFVSLQQAQEVEQEGHESEEWIALNLEGLLSLAVRDRTLCEDVLSCFFYDSHRSDCKTWLRGAFEAAANAATLAKFQICLALTLLQQAFEMMSLMV